MTTRFGILGFGIHAVRRLMPAFAHVQHCSFDGLWRRDQTQARANADQYRANFFATPEALCASPDIDAIFIASPDAIHLEHTLLALRHGKPVLCEKPLAMNAAEARQMVDAAAASNLLLGVAQNYRFNRSLELIRDWIAAGEIGDPVLAHAQFAYPADKSVRTWITDPALANGGPIGDVGVHCIDALRMVLGSKSGSDADSGSGANASIDVSAEVLSVSTLARKDTLSGNVEAYASLQLDMATAAGKPVFANVTSSARTPYRTLVEITGTNGVILAENGLTVDGSLDVVLRRNSELVDTVTLNNQDSFTRMLDGFALALQGQATYPATALDGWKNMRVLDAAYRSWHSGNREPV